jgi:hypothetical protein
MDRGTRPRKGEVDRVGNKRSTTPRMGEVDRVGNKRSTTPRMGEVDRVGNKRSRATQEQLPTLGGAPIANRAKYASKPERLGPSNREKPVSRFHLMRVIL